MNKQLEEVVADKGVSYSFKLVLEYFLRKGGTLEALWYWPKKHVAYAIVKYKGTDIPLRSKNEFLFTVLDSYLSLATSLDKSLAADFLTHYGIKTPKVFQPDDLQAISKFLSSGKTLVVKPNSGSHGEGVTTEIKTLNKLNQALRYARQFDKKIIIQEYVKGQEYRLLFINFELVAAARREPPTVEGDGISNIKQLIRNKNKSRREAFARMASYSWEIKHLINISEDEVARTHGKNFLTKIPKENEKLKLFSKGNIGLGAAGIDATNVVNPKLARNYAKAFKILDLPLCGIDVIARDITLGPDQAGTYLIEINTHPGLVMHARPHRGEPRKVAEALAMAVFKRHKSLQ